MNVPEWRTNTFCPNECPKGFKFNQNAICKTDIETKIKQTSQQIDHLFVIDITSSMSAQITYVKNKISQMVKSLKQKQGENIKFRVGFVGYRDIYDRVKIETIPFTENIPYFISKLSKIVTKGGYDSPEDLYSGLEQAKKMNWKSTHRMISIITDAEHNEKQPGHKLYSDFDELFQSYTKIQSRPDLPITVRLYKVGKQDLKNLETNLQKAADKVDKKVLEYLPAMNFSDVDTDDMSVTDTSKDIVDRLNIMVDVFVGKEKYDVCVKKCEKIV